jgi:hypothetical protein
MPLCEWVFGLTPLLVNPKEPINQNAPTVDINVTGRFSRFEALLSSSSEPSAMEKGLTPESMGCNRGSPFYSILILPCGNWSMGVIGRLCFRISAEIHVR